MRGYTTISQSKKLLELGLSPDTADMNWFILPDTVNPKWIARTFPYINDGAIDGNLPCWSLASLLGVLPKEIVCDKGIVYLEFHVWENSLEYVNNANYTLYVTKSYDNPVDACYEMVCWLLENGHVKTE